MQPSATTPICNCNTPSSQPAPGTRDRRVALGLAGIAELHSAGKERGIWDHRLALGREGKGHLGSPPCTRHGDARRASPNSNQHPSTPTSTQSQQNHQILAWLGSPSCTRHYWKSTEPRDRRLALGREGKGRRDRRLAVGREGKGHPGSPTCSRHGDARRASPNSNQHPSTPTRPQTQHHQKK